jgi:hypothetical protein
MDAGMSESRSGVVHDALRLVNDALTVYAANPAARAFVQVIPFVGAVLDAFAGTAGSNIAFDRLQNFVEELNDAIGRVAKHDSAVTAEDLLEAATRAVRGAVETGNREKRQTIAAALAGATSVDRPHELDIETVMASLVSLTPADLTFAADLARRARQAKVDRLNLPPGQLVGPLPETFPPPAGAGADRMFYIARLQAAGLLESVVLPAAPDVRINRRTEPAIEFRFTPTFSRILELLQAGGQSIG